MFTGVTDEEGEQTVRELGGQLVDSVFDCTHLVTDKVGLWIEVDLLHKMIFYRTTCTLFHRMFC